MNSDSAAIPESLANRVRERAARTRSTAGIPLIVLEEMQSVSLSLHDDSRLECAKQLLVAAWQSASSENAAEDDICVV